jgi:type IV pilus assembly protein PilB
LLPVCKDDPARRDDHSQHRCFSLQRARTVFQTDNMLSAIPLIRTSSLNWNNCRSIFRKKTMAAKAFKKRLGELLLESGAITPDQLQIALKNQKETGQRIGSILISLGMLTEEKLTQVIARKLQIPYVNLDDMVIDKEVARAVSAELARKHLVIPVFRIGNVLTVAFYDPLDYIAIDEISYYSKMKIKRVVASKSQIEAAIEASYSIDEAADRAVEVIKSENIAINVDEIDPDSQEDIKGDMPVVKLVNMVVARGVVMRASDIHFDPDESGLRVRFRIDGLMKDVSVLPLTLIPGVVSRIKVMASMDVSEKRLPQDGRFQARFKKNFVDFRVSSLPTAFGEKIGIRILDKSTVVLNLQKMGFSLNNLKRWQELIARPEGLILITGPTGSGKTTTLYATLGRISTAEKSVVTVEDPIEYNLPLITQVQINEKAGLSFATSLRSIVRQNPDILMVGEIRDLATAEIAVRASMTGHLVLSTLHTSDAPVALNRLIDMGIEPYLVSSAVSCVLAQRLVRKLCSACKYEVEDMDPATRDLLERYGLPARIYRAKGCPKCIFQGYSGRTAIHELLIMEPDLRALVNMKVPHENLRQKAVDLGMISLRADGLSKAVEGVTSVEEIMRVSHDHDFSRMPSRENVEVGDGLQV